MKGYVVCVYKSISSEEKLKEYALKAKAAIEKYEGRFVIRGGKTTTNEGEKSPRTVVIEFSSYDKANSFYCLLYTSPSPRDKRQSRMPSSA